MLNHTWDFYITSSRAQKPQKNERCSVWDTVHRA